MGQKTLDRSCEHVEEVRVGWGFCYGLLWGSKEWKGEKVLLVHDLGGLGRCGVGVPHSCEGLGVSKGN